MHSSYDSLFFSPFYYQQCYRPEGFEDDTRNNPDGIDRTTVRGVIRDNGRSSESGSLLFSDWIEACELDSFMPSSVRLFIDETGSMTRFTVDNSLGFFLSDLESNDIPVDEISFFPDREESWIEPFLENNAPVYAPTYF